MLGGALLGLGQLLQLVQAGSPVVLDDGAERPESGLVGAVEPGVPGAALDQEPRARA